MSTSARHPSDELLDGVRRAVSKFGWHGATLERIAKEAGVSRVTLHRRGISKAAILRLLSERYEADYREALQPALTSCATGRERLEQALDAICDLTEEHLETLMALSDEADRALFHEVDGETVSRDFIIEPVRRILDAGKRDGTLRPVDADETATVTVNVVERTYRHLRHVHRWDPARSRRTVIGLVVEGLAP